MDDKTRQLERALAQDFDNRGLRVALARQHLRANAFALQPNQCEKAKRGIYEGGYFGCLAAVHFIHAVMQRADEFGVYEPEDRHFPGDSYPNLWLDEMVPLFVDTDRSNDELAEICQNLISGSAVTHDRILQSRDNITEAIFEWGRGSFNWVYGRTRATYRHPGNSIRWEKENGRDVPGDSIVSVEIDWPKWYYRNYSGGPLLKTERHGQLPSCSILYENPTPEMAKLLCGIGAKFLNHRVLPERPPLEEHSIVPDYDDGYGYRDYIPLHIRGELLMPDCEQLKETYLQQYPDADPENYYKNILDIWPVCIRCPTCDRVYSVWKDGGEFPGCFCEHCQITLLEHFADDNVHLGEFARQHSLLTPGGGGYSYYIPDDCPQDIKQKMIAFIEERYGQ